jgi:hypothetical protein
MEFGDRWATLTPRIGPTPGIFNVYDDSWVYQGALTSADMSGDGGVCTFPNYYYHTGYIGAPPLYIYQSDYSNVLLATYGPIAYVRNYEDFSVDETNMVVYRVDNDYIDKTDLLTGGRITFQNYTAGGSFNGVFFDGKFVWGISRGMFRKMDANLITLATGTFTPEPLTEMLDAYKYGGYWYIGAYRSGFYVYKCTKDSNNFPSAVVAKYGPIVGYGRLGRLDNPL